MKELVERFENAYSRLEETIRENYGPFTRDSPVYWWEKEMLFGEDRHRMKMLRELRNLYAHNPTFDRGSEVAYPSEEAIDFLLGELEKAGVHDYLSSRMIPFSRVMKAYISSPVWKTITDMSSSGFSSVPIIDNERRVIGILSEKLITRLLVKHRALCFSENLTFEELGEEVLFHNREEEVNYLVLGRKYQVRDAEMLLSREWGKGRRVDMILVTGNGRLSSPLEGILTPYDLF